MEQNVHNSFDLYHDITKRTNGQVYLGIVGPVRTGKSTFIKRFMDLMVLPNIIDPAEKIRANDELPQSSAGKTITTTEPKFIPKEAVTIKVDQAEFAVRVIDCVGFMIDGAAGHLENDTERMVKTPWFDEEIPFTKAASIGTQKVIKDHSTVGIVITTDGSFGDFERKQYIESEEKTILQLQSIGKPFVVIVNSSNPGGKQCLDVMKQIKDKYHCSTLGINCQNLSTQDVHQIFQEVLNEFPIREIVFDVPKWVKMLGEEHVVFRKLLEIAQQTLDHINCMGDAKRYYFSDVPEYFENIFVSQIDMSRGKMMISIRVEQQFYYAMLSEFCGELIENEMELVNTIKELAAQKEKYSKVSDAMMSVEGCGYGIVTPTREQIQIEDPKLIQSGSRYGVNMKAQANTVYMLSGIIQTELSPIVGSEQQAKDLLSYIKNNSEKGMDDLWETNIFGKTVEELVMDGIHEKMHNATDENMEKLRDTMQKVMNENTGLVCLIV